MGRGFTSRVNRAGASLSRLVGGLAFEDASSTWQTVDADAFAATAEQAVEIGVQLTSS